MAHASTATSRSSRASIGSARCARSPPALRLALRRRRERSACFSQFSAEIASSGRLHRRQQRREKWQEAEMAEAEGEASLARGMFAALWPKVDRCEGYVGELLDAQAQLQATVDKLIAGLREAEKADSSSLVGYAERLRDFPARVERLQKKLELIEDRLLAMKQARDRGASCVAKYPSAAPAVAPATVVDPSGYIASPLF